MDKHEMVVIDLDRLAALMAQALADLECPDCCGPVYQFIEVGVTVYQEEWEWACFVHTLRNGRLAQRTQAGRN
jgi:hypothetical protein